MYEIELYSPGDCSQGQMMDKIFIDNDGELPSEESMNEYISQYIETYEYAMSRCRQIISHLKYMDDHYDEVVQYYNIFKEFKNV